jgi:hypothetical protein
MLCYRIDYYPKYDCVFLVTSEGRSMCGSRNLGVHNVQTLNVRAQRYSEPPFPHPTHTYLNDPITNITHTILANGHMQ